MRFFNFSFRIKFLCACALVIGAALAAWALGYVALRGGTLQMDTASPLVLAALGALALSLVFAMVIPLMAFRTMLSPLRALVGVMHDLSAGKTDAAIPFEGRSDEIGQIAAELAVFRQNLATRIAAEEKAKKQRENAEKAYRKEMQIMGNAFETGVKDVVDRLVGAAGNMNDGAAGIMKLSNDSSAQMGRLVDSIGTASTNVQTVAAAAAQLSASIDEIGNQVDRSRKITENAVTESQRANATAASLSDAAKKIGNVLTVINKITEQINLLALNATIEAARAGDAGRGFAVVAGEVKNLAGETAKATQQIEEQISTIQSSAGNTVGVIEAISKIITEISGISSSIAAAVEEQGMATQEIARNVQQTAEIAHNIAEGATSVRQAANDTNTGVNKMMSDTSELSRQSESLRGQIKRFLSDIRET